MTKTASDNLNVSLTIYPSDIIVEDLQLFLNMKSAAWNAGGDFVIEFTRPGKITFKRPKDWGKGSDNTGKEG